MKILTWNIERLKSAAKKGLILQVLRSFDADLVILTETHEAINLPGYYKASTSLLPALHDGIKYKDGENRVTIWSKYPISEKLVTSDQHTSVCAEVETPLGVLRMYGTIIGVFGGKGHRFHNDLLAQLKDIRHLLTSENSCIVGDLNTTFTGYVYPSHAARHALEVEFEEQGLINLTASIPDNVDHIIITKKFIGDRVVDLNIFNEDKSLSDHIGICVEIKSG